MDFNSAMPSLSDRLRVFMRYAIRMVAERDIPIALEGDVLAPRLVPALPHAWMGRATSV